MKVSNEKVVKLNYKLYVAGEAEGQEEMWEEAPMQHPLVYCHGMNMMLPAFEAALEGKEEGENFDFRIGYADAYGDYDEEGVLKLDKQLFNNGDGEFDSERVYEGAVVPMNTVDGQIVNATIAEIGEDKVTIDLNHPLAGEDLHFVGTIQVVRDATPDELEAIRNPHHGCGGCHGGKCGGGDCHCDGGCNGCE